MTCLVSTCPLPAQISTFDFDNEGWKCDGDPQSTNAYWVSSGGNPGGHIQMHDASTGGTWYFVAPAQFLGMKCDAYGKFIRYDQFVSDASNANTFPDVVLAGNGLTLVFDHPIQPSNNWMHYDLFLREDAGWRIGNTVNGAVPTQQQFKSVLANVTALRIRGEYHHFALDNGGLDNVKLESSFAFDLDSDNSSGLTNGDYRADTSCIASSSVTGDDPLLNSEGPIDSIRIALLMPNGLDALSLGNIPPTLLGYQYAPHLITLVNAGNASTSDFLDVVKTLQYTDNSAKPVRSLRQVEFRVFASCGEAARQRAYLPIFPPPQAGFSGDTTVCTQAQPFELFNLLGGSPDPGGMWMPELTSASGIFTPSTDPAGTYAYILAPTKECAGDTAYVFVQTISPPVLQFDTTLCFKETLAVQAPRELLEWEWVEGNKSPVILINEPGFYTIRGKTAHCDFEGWVEARFITCEPCNWYVPNVFSPNRDGQNDLWQVFLPCHWADFRIEVYDRWGSLVFSADTPEFKWDGTSKGKDAPQGVYVWRISWSAEYLGEIQTWHAKGDLTLLH